MTEQAAESRQSSAGRRCDNYKVPSNVIRQRHNYCFCQCRLVQLGGSVIITQLSEIEYPLADVLGADLR